MTGVAPCSPHDERQNLLNPSEQLERHQHQADAAGYHRVMDLAPNLLLLVVAVSCDSATIGGMGGFGTGSILYHGVRAM